MRKLNESIINVLYVVNLDELASQLAEDFTSYGVNGVRNEGDDLIFSMSDGGEMRAEFSFGQYGTIENINVIKGEYLPIWERDFYKSDTWSYEDFKDIFSYAIELYPYVNSGGDVDETIVHRIAESVMRRLNEWGGEQSSLEMTIANAVDDDIDREGMADTGEHTVEVEYDVDNDDTVRGEVSFSLSYLKGTPTLSDFFVDLWIDYGEFHTGEDYNNYSLDDIAEILKNRGVVVQN